MTRLATSFVTNDDLIIVETLVTGPRGTVTGRFVLDTRAAATTMTPERAHLIGYGPRDGFRRTKVHTAIGAEEGYVLRVAEFTVLGFTLTGRDRTGVAFLTIGPAACPVSGREFSRPAGIRTLL